MPCLKWRLEIIPASDESQARKASSSVAYLSMMPATTWLASTVRRDKSRARMDWLVISTACWNARKKSWYVTEPRDLRSNLAHTLSNVWLSESSRSSVLVTSRKPSLYKTSSRPPSLSKVTLTEPNLLSRVTSTLVLTASSSTGGGSSITGSVRAYGPKFQLPSKNFVNSVSERKPVLAGLSSRRMRGGMSARVSDVPSSMTPCTNSTGPTLLLPPAKAENAEDALP
mmetsp:Transcript_23011/g.53780  ORF Transcript_23011/g.53780 Transcript_23011/m.53780 type:complete len:227 (-) Transcript_23011:1534-2214(-)